LEGVRLRQGETKKFSWTIPLNVPKTWIPLIDKARGDFSRNNWIRDLIRDALKKEGLWPEKEDLC